MSIGGIIGKYAIKAAGIAGAGILAYDAHKQGKAVSQRYVNKKNFEALDFYYENSRNMTKPSHVNASLKDGLFKWELKNNLRGFVNGIFGYIKGAAGMIVDDVVPWGLSAAAIFTKGTAAKVSGAALGAYSLYAFAKNVCGFGMTHKK